MGTSIFSFTPLTGYKEYFTYKTLKLELEGGKAKRHKLWSQGKFIAENIALRCPPNTVTTVKSFFSDVDGGYDTFLFKALEDFNNSISAEHLGTTNGVATSFPLDLKYIDPASLVVKINGVATTGGTLTDNYSTPRMVFSPAPAGTDPVTADYDYYYPVSLQGDDVPITTLFFTGDSSTSTYLAEVGAVMQDDPGSHLVA